MSAARRGNGVTVNGVRCPGLLVLRISFLGCFQPRVAAVVVVGLRRAARPPSLCLGKPGMYAMLVVVYVGWGAHVRGGVARAPAVSCVTRARPCAENSPIAIIIDSSS